MKFVLWPLQTKSILYYLSIFGLNYGDLLCLSIITLDPPNATDNFVIQQEADRAVLNELVAKVTDIESITSGLVLTQELYAMNETELLNESIF